MQEKQSSLDLIRAISTKDLIKAFGGWIEGHVIFENGEHGNGYVDNLRFLKHPQIMTEIGCRLAQQFSDFKDKIDVVVGPSIIGAVIAYSTASNLNVPYTTTYSDYRTGEMTFHRGFVPTPDSKCLFVDDFIFSGTSAQKNVNFMEEVGLTVIGISVIGSRQAINLGIPLRSLITIDFVKTPAEKCFLCKNSKSIIAYNIRE